MNEALSRLGFTAADAFRRASRVVAPFAALLGGVSCAASADEAGSGEVTAGRAEAITEASGSVYLEAVAPNNAFQVWDDISAESEGAVAQASPDTPWAGTQTITLMNYTGSTQNYAYYRFVVDNFTAQPTQALIWLYVDEGEPAVATEGLKLRVTTDAWSQINFTYRNAPGTMDGGVGIGPVVVDLTNTAIPDGAFGSGATVGVSGWQAIDVSSVVKGNGIYSFRLAWSGATSGSNHGVTFRSAFYYWESGVYDINHQCGGSPCVRLQVTGQRNPTSSTCPERISAPTQFGVLPATSTANLNQDSGLVASAKYANYFYTHNDRSGQSGSGKFFMLGPLTAGTAVPAHVYAYTLPSGFWQSNYSDTEEIQVGPGPKVNTSYVYFGDIGDNNQNRDFVQILRVEEPGQSSATVSGQTLKVKYPLDYYATGQPRLHVNSEAFIIDPVNGSLYIIEKPCNGKGTLGYNSIFYLNPLPPSYFGDGIVHELTWNFIGIPTGDFPNADNFSTSCSDQTVATAGQRATGATVNRTGTAIAVTFYGQTKFWWLNHRGDGFWGWGGPEATLYLNVPSYGFECDITATNPGSSDVDTKREAIAFTRDTLNSGVHFFTTGEATSHSIWRY